MIAAPWRRRLICALAWSCAAFVCAEAPPPVYELSVIGRRFKVYSGNFPALALSPDGRLALTGDERGLVAVWDVARGEKILSLRGHRDQVFAVSFSKDGKTALSGSWDGTLRLWRVDQGTLIRAIKTGGGRIFPASFSEDQSEAISGDEKGTVRLWRVADGAPLGALAGHQTSIVGAEFLGGGAAITADMDNHVIVWDVALATATRSFERRGHFIVGRFVAPDRKNFLFAGEPLELREAASGALVRQFPQRMPDKNADVAAAFSPDGARFVVEAEDNRVNLWETASGRLERVFLAPAPMRAAAFTPDGRELIAAFGNDGKPAAIIAWAVEPSTPAAARRSTAAAVWPEAASPEVVELGKILLFDPRLSKDASVSCASCHNPKTGWTDRRPFSVGVGGKLGRRHSRSLLNAGLRRPLFWDGRAKNLEDQALFPISDPNEMDSSPEAAAQSVAAIAGYAPYFKAAFGDSEVTSERIARAIADFERTLVSLDSPYDRYTAGDAQALSDAARRGLGVFRGKARCFSCHDLSPATNAPFFDIGIKSRGDPGRFGITKDEQDRGAFLVPDLHDVAYTGPYMHDGSLQTLDQVIAFYDKGGGESPTKIPWLQPLRLGADEKSDLKAFLESLSGDPVAMDSPARLPR